MRYILHVKSTENNYSYHITDYSGNTVFWITAKQLKIKSKQMRSTIIIQKVWNIITQKIHEYNYKNLNIFFSGPTYLQTKFIVHLLKNNCTINCINVLIPHAFNGSKIKHSRRV